MSAIPRGLENRIDDQLREALRQKDPALRSRELRVVYAFAMGAHAWACEHDTPKAIRSALYDKCKFIDEYWRGALDEIREQNKAPA